ncbi:hypothetical protein OIO90_003193 [Microbotryomycetes sp. JL221]|nr:hypothetical protein OIO90_003193 [Microbotryomycetes sp. JL221]
MALRSNGATAGQADVGEFESSSTTANERLPSGLVQPFQSHAHYQQSHDQFHHQQQQQQQVQQQQQQQMHNTLSSSPFLGQHEPLSTFASASGLSGHVYSVWDSSAPPQAIVQQAQYATMQQPSMLASLPQRPTRTADSSRSDDGNGSSSPKPQRRSTTSRSAMACVLCRKQKMKCEGKDKAPCKRCRAAKVECTFEPSQSGTNLPRSRGLSKEWVEERMATVEERLIKLESRRSSLSSDTSSPLESENQGVTATITNGETGPKESSTAVLEARIAQLEAQVFALTFAATNGRHGVFAGSATPTVIPQHALYQQQQPQQSEGHFTYTVPLSMASATSDSNGSSYHRHPGAHAQELQHQQHEQQQLHQRQQIDHSAVQQALPQPLPPTNPPAFNTFYPTPRRDIQGAVNDVYQYSPHQPHAPASATPSRHATPLLPSNDGLNGFDGRLTNGVGTRSDGSNAHDASMGYSTPNEASLSEHFAHRRELTG